MEEEKINVSFCPSDLLLIVVEEKNFCLLRKKVFDTIPPIFFWKIENIHLCSRNLSIRNFSEQIKRTLDAHIFIDSKWIIYKIHKSTFFYPYDWHSASDRLKSCESKCLQKSRRHIEIINTSHELCEYVLVHLSMIHYSTRRILRYGFDLFFIESITRYMPNDTIKCKIFERSTNHIKKDINTLFLDQSRTKEDMNRSIMTFHEEQRWGQSEKKGEVIL